MSPQSGVSIDSFTLPNYDVPDAMPATLANDNQTAEVMYMIPPAVWMLVFLLVGYLGLRMVLED